MKLYDEDDSGTIDKEEMIVLLESISCNFEKVKSTFLRKEIKNIVSKSI